MRQAWLYFLPLLFLPNLGMGIPTGFGILELSDFLIAPYILLVSIAGRRTSSMMATPPVPLMFLFLVWAYASTVLIDWRFGYITGDEQTFGLLKLGKLTLYGLAGVLTIKALSRQEAQNRFLWSLVAAGIVLGLSLFITGLSVGASNSELDQLEGYKANNAISVMGAVLVSYLGGLLLMGQGSERWRKIGKCAILVIVLGLMLSEGRGGWLAAIVGLFYLLYKFGARRRILAGSLAFLLLGALAYYQFPVFSDQVQKTIWPDQEYLDLYNSGLMGIDDGGRLSIWQHEVEKILAHPVLGAGFFHRGGRSGLAWTGSHNFWIQMFLETGIPGGFLILSTLLWMWLQATRLERIEARQGLPVKTALIVAFVGGMGGEYFYGGMVLFTLLAVYASVGASATLVDKKHDLQTSRLCCDSNI